MTLCLPNRYVFEGEWVEGVQNGKGMMWWEGTDDCFHGTWKDGEIADQHKSLRLGAMRVAASQVSYCIKATRMSAVLDLWALCSITSCVGFSTRS